MCVWSLIFSWVYVLILKPKTWIVLKTFSQRFVRYLGLHRWKSCLLYYTFYCISGVCLLVGSDKFITKIFYLRSAMLCWCYFVTHLNQLIPWRSLWYWAKRCWVKYFRCFKPRKANKYYCTTGTHSMSYLTHV